MRAAVLLVVGVLLLPMAALANPVNETHNFAILRNGGQIGTYTLGLRRNGRDTSVEISTRLAVKIAFLTLYRFDQTEREHWVDGHLVSMVSTTDDDGIMHRVTADASGGALVVTVNGKTKRMPGGLMPSSLWNPNLARQTTTLSTVDGALMRVAVADRGNEDLSLGGHKIAAHHYSLSGIYPQEVWYDDRGDLVRLQLRGSDGSTIVYRPAPPPAPGSGP